MIIETYEVNEVTPEGVDTLDADAIAMIERLGLTGQKSLMSKGAEGATTVMPYQPMTAEEFAVYRLLFPARDDVAAYSAGPIPLRVLQVIAFAKSEGWFKTLEVWHKTTGSAKDDPVLVGVAEHDPRTWEDKRFLLARWGDALAPFSQLLAQAGAAAKAQIKAALSRVRSDVESAMAAVEHVDDSTAARWAANGIPMAGNLEAPRS